MRQKRFPIYSMIGLLILLFSGIGLFLHIRPIAIFFTPIVWTGYILFVDGVVQCREGHSLIVNRTGEFLIMLPISIVCWLIFEAYNVHIRNWHYENLPEAIGLRWLGYGWSFATIFPGIFETSDLLRSFGLKVQSFRKYSHIPSLILIVLMIIGLIFLLIPLFLSWQLAQYLAICIWLGFIFFLDPLNYWTGTQSILKDIENGQFTKLVSLAAAGLICGFLWEFWNFWAESRWIYDVPICQNIKVFEMVLPGYLGFIPFAVECYVMYHFFLRIFFRHIPKSLK
jgi:hypothetical protein